MKSQIESIALAQPLGGRDEQLGAVDDLATDVVRHAAIGERRITAAFEHHDLRRLIQPSSPRGRRRSARHSTDNDQLHESQELLGNNI